MSANMKLIRNIIIAVVALAVLGGGYYFALYWEPQKDEGNEALPTTDTEAIDIVSEAVEDVAKIQIKNGQTEFDILRSDEGYSIPAIGNTAVNELRVAAAFAGLVKLSAEREITNDVSKVSEYGLDKEEKCYAVHKNDGTKTTVLMGDEVPTGGEFYCMIKGGKKIYTVSAQKMSYIESIPEDYRVSAVTAIEDVATVQTFTVYHNASPVMKIRPTTEDEFRNSIMAGAWTMEYPWTERADPEKLEGLFTPFMEIEATGFAESASGITFEYEVRFSTDDAEYQFSIGNAAGEDVVYLRDDKTLEVYIVDSSLRDAVTGLNPNDYLIKFICLADITEVSNAIVKLGDKEYVMKPGNKAGKAYKINGEEVDEAYFKNQYQIVLGLVFRERGDFSVSGDPYMTITYEYSDGRVVTTRYYEYDERDFVAVRDDGATVKLLRSEIGKIEKLFEE